MTASHSPSSRQPPVTTEGEAFGSDPTRLRYLPIEPPQGAALVEAAPGVLWGRIPLPIDLNHINVWLLEAGDGCMIVDTGMAASMGRDAWEAIAARVFEARPLRGVFVTHIHPDHIGLAGWLQQRFGAPVTMSGRTFEIARSLLEGSPQALVGQAERFLTRNGLEDADAAQLASMFSPERFARMASGLPVVERFVADGQTPPWASDWTAMQTDGHAEGHLCLFNAALPALISGDQVLPTISSNISLRPDGADPDPLGSFLDSLRRLRALPADTLVLPAHGRPFYGLQQRIDDLLDHHQEQLNALPPQCAEPKCAVEVLPSMFRRPLKGLHLFLALGEALAHLEHLALAGRLERVERGGVVRYRRSD